jgi:hypothetical protein
MPWSGSGTFNRIYSWVADKAAGLDISSSRMDADTNDIASSGFGNCLTRDGQGQPATNLPMNSFRHTGVANGQNRTDYAALGQVQDGLANWTIAGGSADALTATYTPAITGLVDGELFFLRAAAANVTTTPTFAPNGFGPYTITKLGGSAVAVGDIAGNLAEIVLRYNLANARFELLNPSNNSIINGAASSGDVKLTSCSSNSNSALNQALFTLMFNNISDSNAPIFTSTGAGTTRAGQGTAAAAWAANCRMSLPKTLGRALAVAGSGSGLSARALGATVGAETNALSSLTQIPQFTPAGTVSNGAITSMTVNVGSAAGGGPLNITTGAFSTSATWNFGNSGLSFTQNGSTFSGNAVGSASPSSFSIMPPETFLNAMIKQ